MIIIGFQGLEMLLQFPLLCIISGFLYSLIMAPLLDLLDTLTVTQIDLPYDQSFLADEHSNQTREERRTFHFDHSYGFRNHERTLIPGSFASDPDSACPRKHYLNGKVVKSFAASIMEVDRMKWLIF